MKDKDTFVTSKELATHLKCSDRTIRTYYKTLVEKLDDYSGIDLISKQGYGYKLGISDDDAYADFWKKIISMITILIIIVLRISMIVTIIY